MQKITPHLWFDREAEEAARFYASIFPHSKVGKISHYGKEGFEVHGMPEGTVLTVEFELNGQSFIGLNGGPIFKFNESVSFMIPCDTQEEIDFYWGKLSAVPESEQCGWVKDKFGLSWQVAPSMIGKMLSEGTKEQGERVMKAMLQMKKIDIAALQKAYEGN
jgi:predicted 3-demethylubiquinone-9 3-methyltransferase (glyoxalase superfamily)